MHELAIVEALIEQAQRELDRAGEQGRAVRLELGIGRLSGVNSESVRFAFELLAPGTCVEGAEVVIREPKAVCRCRACNARVEIDSLVAECPQCSSDDIVIEGGRELMLQSIDVGD
jgi:hydrogenase nickel incorporation protein HypA/HybF